MTTKTYTCPRYRTFQLGDRIKFMDGFFKTDNIFLQNIIEKHDWFGWNIKLIHKADEQAIDDALAAADEAQMPFDADLIDFDGEDSDDPIEVDSEDADEGPRFSKSELNKMKVLELKELAEKVGVEGEIMEMKRNQLIRAVALKLGA